MEKREIIIIANRIRSLHNVGSIFRTSDALGIAKLYLVGRMATPKNQPRLAKTSLGAENTVLWEHVHQLKPLIKKLQNEGFEVIALELNKRKSLDFRSWSPKQKVAVILGNEVAGISSTIQSHCDQVIHLPMLGKKNSLNVSVAYGAIGYYLLQ